MSTPHSSLRQGPEPPMPSGPRRPPPSLLKTALGLSLLAAGGVFLAGTSPAAEGLALLPPGPESANPIATVTDIHANHYTDMGVAFNSWQAYAVCAEYDITGLNQDLQTEVSPLQHGTPSHVTGAQGVMVVWSHNPAPDRFRRYLVFRWLGGTSAPDIYNAQLPSNRARVCMNNPVNASLTDGSPQNVTAQAMAWDRVRVRFWQSDLDQPIQSLTVLAQDGAGGIRTEEVPVNGGTAQSLSATPGRQHEVQVSGLSGSTEYTVTVRANWSGGHPPSTSSTTVTTPMEPLPAPSSIQWTSLSGGIAESTAWTYRASWSGISQHAATWRCQTSGPNPGDCDGAVREVGSSANSVELDGLRPDREHALTVCTGTAEQQSEMQSQGISSSEFCLTETLTTPAPRPARPEIGSDGGTHIPGMDELLAGDAPPDLQWWAAWHAVRWQPPFQDASQPEAHLWPADSWEIYRIVSPSSYQQNRVLSTWELLASYTEATAPSDVSGPGWRHAEEELPFDEERHYTVCARNSTGASCALEPVSISVSESEIPSLDELPTDVVAVVMTPFNVTTRIGEEDPQVEVRWSSSVSVSGFGGMQPQGFRVEIRSQEDGHERIEETSADQTSLGISGLEPLHPFETRVCSVHSAVPGGACTEWHAFRTTLGGLVGMRFQVADEREYLFSWAPPVERARSFIGNDLTLESSTDGTRWTQVSTFQLRSERLDLGRFPRGPQYRLCIEMRGERACTLPHGREPR